MAPRPSPSPPTASAANASGRGRPLQGAAVLPPGSAGSGYFEQAFGMNGQELWAKELRHYSKRLFYLVYDFRPEALDLDFQRAQADVAAIEALLDELKSDR